MRRTLAGAAFAFTLMAGAAHATEWTVADCTNGELNFETFQTWRMELAGLGPREMQYVRAQGALGDQVDAASTYCNDPDLPDAARGECTRGLPGKLSSMFQATNTLANDARRRPDLQEGYSLRRDVPNPVVDQRARIIAALNGPVSWLGVRCPSTDGPVEPDPITVTSIFDSITEHLIVGKSEEDATRSDMADREFATLSITDDRAAEEETTEINLFLGWQFPMMEAGANNDITYRVVPFISLQKTSVERDEPGPEETDDLTFGISVPTVWRGNIFAPSLKWETDTDFESSVTALRLDWSPEWLLPRCFRAYWSTTIRFRCDYAVVVDYSDVGDAGEKSDLEDINQFARAGFDVGFDYYHDLGEGPAQINFGVNYQRRESLNDEGGDADLLSAVLQILPGDESHFSFGIEYTHGEDLTSLEPDETTMLRIGYRR